MNAQEKLAEPLPVPVRVLIVDDDEAHAEAVAESLERGGRYECTVANSGARGSQLIESDSFDVVITDLRMNDVDGLALAIGSLLDDPDTSRRYGTAGHKRARSEFSVVAMTNKTIAVYESSLGARAGTNSRRAGRPRRPTIRPSAGQ